MNTVIIKLHCPVCDSFELEHEIDVNKHGYLVFPNAYCPECLCILTCVVDKKENDGPRNTTN